MGRPAVVFPDAVLLVVDYLRAVMPGVEVGTRVPADRDETYPEFIRVERLGGARNSLVTDRPRVDVHCWAGSEEAAETLTARARAHVHAMAGRRGDTTVYNVREVTGPQWLPDSTSGQPRYAFAVEFSTRGKEQP
ncbi:hypothetical protein [Streptomyces sp. NPDC050145]|uniref:phage tail termination protein n=1 Tax=Streptomyces sp. NPDC050145 TaxID=3365602 RepID=UPI0037A1F454